MKELKTLNSLNITFKEFLFPFSLWIACALLIILLQQYEEIKLLEEEPVIVEKINFKTFYFDFTKIFINNLFVGLLTVYLGYFSFGLFSIVITLFNSFIFGTIIADFLYEFSIQHLFLGMVHAPLEIIALSIFAAYGLKSFWKINQIIQEQSFRVKDVPSLRSLSFPILLLFVAALIESYFRL